MFSYYILTKENFMKSVIKVIFLVLLAFSAVFQCFSYGGKAPQVITGHIKYYGNSPFEFAGFETEDGYLYTIEIDKNSDFLLADIEKETGYRLELTGKIDKSHRNGPNVLKDGVFIVSDWKKL